MRRGMTGDEHGRFGKRKPEVLRVRTSLEDNRNGKKGTVANGKSVGLQLFVCGREMEERVENNTKLLDLGEQANGSSVEKKKIGGICLGGMWVGKS